jgi:hypothetical protein
VNSIVFGPDLHDSVDADDGVIDGSGLQGDDWWGNGFPGFTFWFDPQVLGGLPTRVGTRRDEHLAASRVRGV